MSKEVLFLSPEWVHQAAAAAQTARQTDTEFAEMVSGFNLSLLYVITELPKELKNSHGDRLPIFVRLEKGGVRQLQIGADVPKEKIDFTVTSRYSVAKQIYTGQINVGTAFVNRLLELEPMSKVYEDPKFTATSIVAGNRLIKIIGQIPTAFAAENQAIAKVSSS